MRQHPDPDQPHNRLMDQSIEARFWAKVNKNGPTMAHMETCCWQWEAAGINYGVFWYKRKNYSSHRVSYFIENKTWPKMVLHKCDNKKCVNPAHLYAGDSLRNAKDASERGLLITGPFNNKTKLTFKQACDIKIQLTKGVPKLRLAKQYGISHQAILNIVKGKAWKSAPWPEF